MMQAESGITKFICNFSFFYNSRTLLTNMFKIFSILGRIVRVTDEVIDYRKWIKEAFPLPPETDSLSSSTGSEASTLSAPASESVYFIIIYRMKI